MSHHFTCCQFKHVKDPAAVLVSGMTSAPTRMNPAAHLVSHRDYCPCHHEFDSETLSERPISIISLVLTLIQDTRRLFAKCKDHIRNLLCCKSCHSLPHSSQAHANSSFTKYVPAVYIALKEHIAVPENRRLIRRLCFMKSRIHKGYV